MGAGCTGAQWGVGGGGQVRGSALLWAGVLGSERPRAPLAASCALSTSGWECTCYGVTLANESLLAKLS